MNGRWSLTGFWQILQPYGYILEFDTDTPCHLWLRYVTRKPPVHLEPVLRRGLMMHCNPRYCFAGYKELEQSQLGDTLDHHFDFSVFTSQARVWFYLIGQIGAVDSPSTSPIMDLPLGLSKRKFQQKQTGYSNSGKAVSWNRGRAMSFSAAFYGGVDGIRIYCYGTNQPAKITYGIWSTEPVGMKPSMPIFNFQMSHVPYKDYYAHKGFLYLPTRHIKTRRLFGYAVVIFGDISQPDLDVFWWSRHALPGEQPTARAWRGERNGAGINWIMDTDSVLQYEAWNGIPNYQPGPIPELLF